MSGKTSVDEAVQEVVEVVKKTSSTVLEKTTKTIRTHEHKAVCRR